ncbi:MAG: tetratricopeptide repeat protein [Deinococcales bacterium]|nr:tetratricopeptide repeat protein [Chitinophagaceae bacterium]
MVGSGVILVLALFLFGKTIPPKKPNTTTTASLENQASTVITFGSLLTKAKQRLTAEQSERITRLENSVTRGDVKEQQLHVYHQLARFWQDSAKIFEPYIFYTAEAAKLENSEKNLTFAARQFIDNLMIEGDPAMQTWLATNAKDLLEKALVLNPLSDSSKIGLGACYILGNISSNPMQGILPVREIAQKNPDNLYAQLILGLGGKKSGQYDKAIERFKIIVTKQPTDLEATLHLAECYDLAGDKANAVKWYAEVKKRIPNPKAQEELDNRIKQLNQ